MPLTLAKPGEANIISRIGGNPAVREHLQSLGFIPGESVMIVTAICGNIIVTLKGTRVAISKEMAQKIIV